MRIVYLSPLRNVSYYFGGSFRSVAWSPDGRLIVASSSDGTARVWNATTGDELQTLRGPMNWVGSVAWSPNGMRIVTAGDDSIARVWDAATGIELSTLSDNIIDNSYGLEAVSWSPDGTRIVTASFGTAKIWRAWQTTEDLIAYARECCVVRELTPEEREQFGLPSA